MDKRYLEIFLAALAGFDVPCRWSDSAGPFLTFAIACSAVTVGAAYEAPFLSFFAKAGDTTNIVAAKTATILTVAGFIHVFIAYPSRYY
jgi:hypothetical protein